jgi:hypothetical protein
MIGLARLPSSGPTSRKAILSLSTCSFKFQAHCRAPAMVSVLLKPMGLASSHVSGS